MCASPFGFYRGAAAIMAADLARIPVTGLRVQLCGDAHLANFGGFATPERRFVFDVNDFDETLPGPWEWDVLRLAASVEIAAREGGIRRRARAGVVCATVRAYRVQMRRYAAMTPLDIWYSHLDARRVEALRGCTTSSGEHVPPNLVRDKHGVSHFVANPPLVEPLDPADDRVVGARRIFTAYRDTLPAHIRVLFERYRLVDLARKVVGVGSVGTRCLVALFSTDRDEPLLLQLKEATASVLETELSHSPFSNHGERVVVGQRLMQAASDLFLGWTDGPDGRDYYVRQLRDMKAAVDPSTLRTGELTDYAVHCGAVLARAHARSGDPQAIAAYLGGSDTFDRAVTRFAASYARQNALDRAAVCKSLSSEAGHRAG